MRLLRAIAICILLVIQFAAPVGASGSFLTDEAGIAAFFQFTGITNLESNLLRNMFRIVSTSNDTYLIGAVPATGFEGQVSEDIKVFIHNAGWVVAYYPKDAPTSKAVAGMADQATRLHDVLGRVAWAMDVVDPQIILTHFQYPLAEHWMRVERHPTQPGVDVFNIRLPADNIYFERSYYLRCTNTWNYAALHLDGREIGRSNAFGYGGIAAGDMVVNAKHVIGVERHTTLGDTWGELSLLYSGTGDFVIDEAEWVHVSDLVPAPSGLESAAGDVPRFFEVYLPIMRM